MMRLKRYASLLGLAAVAFLIAPLLNHSPAAAFSLWEGPPGIQSVVVLDYTDVAFDELLPAIDFFDTDNDWGTASDRWSKSHAALQNKVNSDWGYGPVAAASINEEGFGRYARYTLC